MDSSVDMFERAQRVIPGGVNSPVRACSSVGGKPVFFREGRGSRLVDVDGREYVDVMGSWGPLILGHAHPDVVSAVCDAARGGTSFGACTAAEVELARLSFDAGSGDPDRHLNWLKEALQPVVKGRRFDVVLIDCPPSLGKLTLSVLIAATGLLIPLQCEYYPLEGISSITDLMEQLKSSGVNRKLELLGVLMTMFDSRTNLSRMVVAEVREHFGDKVFRTVIPRATRVAESPSHGKPILYYDPYSAGSAAYEAAAGEMIKRLGLG